jgi:hypothetical protein
VCDRCPVGNRYPSSAWPGQRPQGGDLGPPPDLGRPDHGAAPPIRWLVDLGIGRRRRHDGKPAFITDGR